MNQDTFERELARRAEDVHGVTISFDDVRRRAGSIRRRRRATAAGAVAAAAVAVVALAPTMLTPGTDDAAPDPAGPTTAPGGSVLHDGVVTLPNGATVDLPVGAERISTWGRLTDGRFVVAANQPNRVRIYAADGTLESEHGAGASPVRLSATDDVAAWMEGDGTVQVLESGAADPVALGRVPTDGELPPMLDAVVDAGHVLVSDGVSLIELSADGGREIAADRPLKVTDVSPDGSLWAVQYPDDADPQFGCAGLLDPDTNEVVATNCETADLRFSPDGRHLLGMRGDNNMYGDAVVLDLDLDRVGGWESTGDGDVVSRAAWADAGHLLVAETSWQDSTWSLVRVDLRWSEREVLDGPAAGGNPEIVVEYSLSE